LGAAGRRASRSKTVESRSSRKQSNDPTPLDLLQPHSIPDSTTAGDFCRRYAATQIDALQDKINALQDKINALQDKINALQDKIDALQDKINALQDKIDALQDKINALQGKINVL
jgi:peptidoglycan hydrolase CwlO-like protein